ncbi:hypothetical protein M407DRAFT_34522 [Tulasnella calospora MUT 4182]|uniref:Uncharacterized protein n=1 Tax=Tulasnella calospora MUT 4182 TaxID=1051891 RepID=A0A0C3Q0J5_9AGAM|nr:hypothetical protein M407DRAFT_34522 [Tulasnella calospora MUT 4182]
MALNDATVLLSSGLPHQRVGASWARQGGTGLPLLEFDGSGSIMGINIKLQVPIDDGLLGKSLRRYLEVYKTSNR